MEDKKMKKETEWLIFKEGKPKPKTKVFNVISKCDESHLGVIKWYPQ